MVGTIKGDDCDHITFFKVTIMVVGDHGHSILSPLIGPTSTQRSIFQLRLEFGPGAFGRTFPRPSNHCFRSLHRIQSIMGQAQLGRSALVKSQLYRQVFHRRPIPLVQKDWRAHRNS